MQEIRDAILSGDRTQETYAGLSIPESYRAVTVHKDEVEMFEGLASKDKDPRKSLHLDDVPVPELAPGEALVAVMASAINYNTVWTSIFEPVSTFGFLERYGRTSEFAKRHDLPYHVVGSDLAGVVLRTGPGVTKWKPGQEVVAHCLSRRARGRRGPQRHDARPAAADLGLRDQLRRPRRARHRQVQPADAQARPPVVGGGGLPRAGELHGLPPAHLQERRRHEARRPRAHLGRLRRPRVLRHPDGPGRRRDPDLRRVLAREGPDLPRHGCRADHRPQRRGLPVLERRQHRSRTRGSGSGSARRSAS